MNKFYVHCSSSFNPLKIFQFRLCDVMGISVGLGMYFVTTGGLDHWVTESELHNNKGSSSPWTVWPALSDKIQLLTPALIYVMNTRWWLKEV